MLSGAITVVDTGAAPVDPVIIDSAPLTNGTVGTGYTHTFTSVGGTGTGKVWSKASGTFPTGSQPSGVHREARRWFWGQWYAHGIWHA